MLDVMLFGGWMVVALLAVAVATMVYVADGDGEW